jgi:hypothetical protein
VRTDAEPEKAALIDLGGIIARRYDGPCSVEGQPGSSRQLPPSGSTSTLSGPDE